uniref:Uncharacterized protein n=1 Tax=Anguilla anguilla TaxID=7936 RepID=A0A0E9PQP7_ANGAN
MRCKYPYPIPHPKLPSPPQAPLGCDHHISALVRLCVIHQRASGPFPHRTLSGRRSPPSRVKPGQLQQ